MKRFGALLGGVALLALAACGGETKAPLTAITAAEVDGAAIIAADQRPDIWISHGRTYSEQRYSPLKLINTDEREGPGPRLVARRSTPIAAWNRRRSWSTA